MRNGQNKRMRGRNRKSHNPMTRVYESNGPDIKIRGTASHVAEKYVQLARDAQTSGDPVGAENYYQHAEHYFRMIATMQEQFRQNQPNFYRAEGGGGNDTHSGNDSHSGNDMQDESFDDGEDDGAGAPTQGAGGEQPQFGTRDPQPYLPRDAQFFSPRDQQQQYGGRPQQDGGRPQQDGGRPQQGGEQRHNRGGGGGDDGNVDRLPSFITGGQAPQQQPQQNASGNPGGPPNGQNGFDNQGGGERFPMHRRRRRHRGPRGDMPRGGTPEGGDDAPAGE
jgi:hypothetical protein